MGNEFSMNRQTAAHAENRPHSTWIRVEQNRQDSNEPNREKQTGNGSWETSSSRMNRQAAAHAENRPHSTWIRVEENRQDSNAPTRENIQR